MDAQKMSDAKPHTRNSSPQSGQMGATYAGGIFTAINQPSLSSPPNSFFHQAGEFSSIAPEAAPFRPLFP